ncbi:MAG: hypothetical protein ACOCQD_03550 [archaeon]
MNLKVGDVVKIKPKEWFDEQYGICFDGEYRIERPPGWNPQMTKYLGRETKISDISASAFIVLEIDNGEFSWLPKWVISKNPMKLDSRLFEI